MHLYKHSLRAIYCVQHYIMKNLYLQRDEIIMGYIEREDQNAWGTRRELNPVAWLSRCQALHSSTTEKLKDLVHACVPVNGAMRSWSPLHQKNRKLQLIGRNNHMEVEIDNITCKYYKHSPLGTSCSFLIAKWNCYQQRCVV